jgi:hypothetical protein
MLASIYLDGNVEKNILKNTQYAIQLLNNGSTGGCPQCKNALGMMYLNGEGVAKDIKKAIELFSQASAVGNHDGTFNLGAIYYQGHVKIPQGINQAIELFTQANAAEVGAAARDAAVTLCNIYLHGEQGITVNLSLAFKHAQQYYRRSKDPELTLTVLDLARQNSQIDEVLSNFALPFTEIAKLLPAEEPQCCGISQEQFKDDSQVVILIEASSHKIIALLDLASLIKWINNTPTTQILNQVPCLVEPEKVITFLKKSQANGWL